MIVQFFCYNEAGEFLGVVMAMTRTQAFAKARKEFPDEKIGLCRAAPL